MTPVSLPHAIEAEIRARALGAIPAAGVMDHGDAPAADARLPALSVQLAGVSAEPSGMREYQARLVTAAAEVVLWRGEDPALALDWNGRDGLRSQGFADATAIARRVVGRPYRLGGLVARLVWSGPEVSVVRGERRLLRVVVGFDMAFEEAIP